MRRARQRDGQERPFNAGRRDPWLEGAFHSRKVSFVRGSYDSSEGGAIYVRKALYSFGRCDPYQRDTILCRKVQVDLVRQSRPTRLSAAAAVDQERKGASDWSSMRSLKKMHEKAVHVLLRDSRLPN